MTLAILCKLSWVSLCSSRSCTYDCAFACHHRKCESLHGKRCVIGHVHSTRQFWCVFEVVAVFFVARAHRVGVGPGTSGKKRKKAITAEPAGAFPFCVLTPCPVFVCRLPTFVDTLAGFIGYLREVRDCLKGVVVNVLHKLDKTSWLDGLLCDPPGRSIGNALKSKAGRDDGAGDGPAVVTANVLRSVLGPDYSEIRNRACGIITSNGIIEPVWLRCVCDVSVGLVW